MNQPAQETTTSRMTQLFSRDMLPEETENEYAERQAMLGRKEGVNFSSDHMIRVAHMMRKFGQPVPMHPTIPVGSTRVLRARLLLEEVLELIEAMGIDVLPQHLHDGKLTFEGVILTESNREPDIEKVADGCADVSVVNTGTMIAFGISDVDLLREVDLNNILKADTGHRDEHGKFIKHPDHPAPNIQRVLLMQGCNPDLLTNPSSTEKEQP